MQYNSLGSSSLTLSRLGFGCMSLQPNDSESIRLLQEAFDSGITYFDTADLYNRGENERLVGRALKEVRKGVVLATKVGNEWNADGKGWQWNPGKEYILKAVEESLQRLQTDYIDLYQLHGGTIDDPMEETLEAFELLVQQGKIRHYGISSIRPNVIRRWADHSAMVSVMMQYSLLDRRPEEAVLPQLEQKGLAVLARGPLAQGLLAGKPPKDYLGYSEAQVARLQQVLETVQKGSTPESLALHFLWQRSSVSSAVVGIRTSAQLQEALHAEATPPPPEELLQQLETILPPNQYTTHR